MAPSTTAARPDAMAPSRTHEGSRCVYSLAFPWQRGRMRRHLSIALVVLASLSGCFKASESDDTDELGDTGATDDTPAICGDGTVGPDEDCDDGNTLDTDACTNACTSAICGDGIVRTGVEGCDDGNTDAGDGCSPTCELESCGDGQVQAGEQCDDGNADDTDACTSLCSEASCGDGFVQASVEACDDGNIADNDACLTSCELASCGDGFLQAGVETCDDGDDVDSDGCPTNCQNASCGDGFVHAGFEECDDGNTVSGDGCSDACISECGTDCWGASGCLTAAGRCIRFTCRAGSAGGSFCDSCMGWEEVSYQQWLNEGYCADISGKYRAEYGYAAACGGAGSSCCGSQAECGGGDWAWHFWDGGQTHYVGPCLGCMDVDNCTYWDEIDNSDYTRLSVCVRQ